MKLIVQYIFASKVFLAPEDGGGGGAQLAWHVEDGGDHLGEGSQIKGNIIQEDFG